MMFEESDSGYDSEEEKGVDFCYSKQERVMCKCIIMYFDSRDRISAKADRINTLKRSMHEDTLDADEPLDLRKKKKIDHESKDPIEEPQKLEEKKTTGEEEKRRGGKAKGRNHC